MVDIQKLTILLVEDNPGDALLIRHLIKKVKLLEVELLVAVCLADAFAYLDASARKEISGIDLILLDLQLPDSDENQTFARMRDKTHSIPVIVLSNIKDEHLSLQAIKEGAQDYLLKGEIDSKLLKKSIWYAIERNNLFQERLLVTQELRAHEALLKLITRISTTFINLSSEQIDDSINHTLGMVGSFLEADHAFIVEMNGRESLRHSYEWMAPMADKPLVAVSHIVGSSGAAAMAMVQNPPIAPLQLGLQKYHWVMEEVRKNGVFSLNTLDELPLDDHDLRNAMQSSQVESLLLVAIYYEKKLAALFGLASRQAFKLWNEETISLLNPSGEIFYRAIKKKQAEETVKESEKKYRTLVENMNEGLVHIDAEGKIQFVNDRVVQMLGYSSEELVGGDVVNSLLFDEGDRTFLAKRLRVSRDNDLLQQYELPMRTKSNNWVWMLVNGHAVLNSKGEIMGTMATLVDITDRKKTEEKLQRVNQELKTFIYRASHDLRGPLASVLGLTNLAQMQIQDVEALKFFDYIRTSVFKLDKTLKALTDVASITQLAEDFTEIDFHQLVDDVIGNVVSNSGIETQVEKSLVVHQPMRFMSGQQPLRYIFENLIDNSVKYRKHTRGLKLSVKVHVYEKHADIELSDNGMGIPSVLQSRVFDMFFRGNANSNGSGLGLYVVEKLLSSLKGQIRMESTEGEGTRFFIHLKNMA
jgi:PAS domain S-box-containing protein